MAPSFDHTLDCATSNPSLSNSPWMRGAPQLRIFDAHPPDQYAQFRVDLPVALPVGATSNASSNESRHCGNARVSRVG